MAMGLCNPVGRMAGAVALMDVAVAIGALWLRLESPLCLMIVGLLAALLAPAEEQGLGLKGESVRSQVVCPSRDDSRLALPRISQAA